MSLPNTKQEPLNWQEKLKQHKEALLLLAIAIVVGTTFVFISKTNVRKSAETVEMPQPSFGEGNYCILKTEAFVQLAKQAYGNFLTVEEDHNELVLSITKSNELARDFFNGNDSLLQFDKRDFGFEIDYNANAQSVTATFAKQEQGGVAVPNDILIKMLDKTYAQKNNDNPKADSTADKR